MTLADWNVFYAAQCGASAALIGLIFVALSINLQRILSIAYLVDRVAEVVLVFFGLLTVSIFALAPHQSDGAFGIEALVTGVLIWAVTTRFVVRGIRSHPKEATPGSIVLRTIQLQVATLATVAGGALLVTGHESGFYWLLASTIATYFIGVATVWVLTIEILR